MVSGHVLNVICIFYLKKQKANSRHSATELLVSWAGVAAVAAPTGKQHSAEVHCVSNEFVELSIDRIGSFEPKYADVCSMLISDVKMILFITGYAQVTRERIADAHV